MFDIEMQRFVGFRVLAFVCIDCELIFHTHLQPPGGLGGRRKPQSGPGTGPKTKLTRSQLEVDFEASRAAGTKIRSDNTKSKKKVIAKSSAVTVYINY